MLRTSPELAKSDWRKKGNDTCGRDASPTAFVRAWEGAVCAVGERLIEYMGEMPSLRRAAAPQRSDDRHTFVFGLPDGRVIDGSRAHNARANAARQRREDDTLRSRASL